MNKASLFRSYGAEVRGNRVILYRGADVPVRTIKKLRYGDYLSASEGDVDTTGNGGAKAYGKNVVRFELPLDDVEVSGAGEFLYNGKSSSFSKGRKYPEKIYKAYCDVEGCHYSGGEIDMRDDVRSVASQGLSGGREEFDSLMKKHGTCMERLNRVMEGRRFWGLRASGILFRRESDGSVCLLRRSETMQSGTWGIPGGKVDRGEDAKESSIREVEEEVGGLPEGRFTGKKYVFRLPLTSDDYISGSRHSTSPDENRYARDGEEFVYTTFLYDVTDDSWVPDLNYEHDDSGWFDPSDLPQTLSLRDLEGNRVYPVAEAISYLV